MQKFTKTKGLNRITLIAQLFKKHTRMLYSLYY